MRGGTLGMSFMMAKTGTDCQASCLRIISSYPNLYQKLGKVGKKNQKKILALRSLFPQTGRILCLLILGSCHSQLSDAMQSGRVFSLHGLQGRWVGEVAPTDGACGPTTKGLMTIGEHGFALDPFQGATVIRGDVENNSRLVGKLVRTGAGHQDLVITFEGQASADNAIDGLLQSGKCRWTVALHRG